MFLCLCTSTIFSFFSPDTVTHEDHVRQVLQKLLENQLYVKAEKFDFHAATISFLGYVVSANQVHMDSAKVSAVANWPTPNSRKKVKQFLGFANFYRKFIRNFSSVATPLHALTSSKVSFQWNPRQRKPSGASRNVLTRPRYSLFLTKWQFVVEVDASNEGIGAVLSQRSAKDNRINPCAYLSCKLTPAEKNYDVGNKEQLAVKAALGEWRHWLEGAEQPFLVWTDHKTWNTSGKLRDSIHKLDGPCSLTGSISPYPFNQVHKMQNQMLCPAFMTLRILPKKTRNYPSTEPCSWSGFLADRIRCEAG